jgi:hypothetical protein
MIPTSAFRDAPPPSATVVVFQYSVANGFESQDLFGTSNIAWWLILLLASWISEKILQPLPERLHPCFYNG